jgi:hypothetical protein
MNGGVRFGKSIDGVGMKHAQGLVTWDHCQDFGQEVQSIAGQESSQSQNFLPVLQTDSPNARVRIG